MPLRIAALLTCHNRRETTVACLRALRKQASPKLTFQFSMLDGPSNHNPKSIIPNQNTPILIEVFLVDDGCTDGTADAVCEIWPEATIIHGDGNLFWCGGMRVAWARAAKTDPDYFLLLNDDTKLLPSALESLLEIVPDPDCRCISVGAIADPLTGDKTYGGTALPPLHFPSPDGKPQECILFNGNSVLVPQAVFKEIGAFHHAFTHSLGDADYSHEARRHGIRIFETAVAVGTCGRNPVVGTWKDQSISRYHRLLKLKSPKGLPYPEWLIFCQRNCGKQWLRYFFSPTLRILVGR